MNKNGFAPIAIILFVVAVAIAAGVIWHYKFNFLKIQTNESAPNVVSVPQSPIKPTSARSTSLPASVSSGSSPEIQKFPYAGTTYAYPPFEISSIDTAKQTFEYVGCGPACQSEADITYKVVPETLIKNKDGAAIHFKDFAVGDEVFVRGIPQTNKSASSSILTKQVFVITGGHTTALIINKIDLKNMTLTGEAFIGDNKTQTIRLLPETEIRKGTAAQGRNRPVVSLADLKVGDIAGSIMIISRNDGDYAVDVDVISPYPCETYIKPRGCVE